MDRGALRLTASIQLKICHASRNPLRPADRILIQLHGGLF